MRPRGLIDTGALLALLDRSDRWHEPCVNTFTTAPLPLATSAAVLAELFHLLGSQEHDLKAAWKLLRTGAIQVLSIDNQDMAAIESLMLRYRDRPMDFADATLVHLAQRESVSYILTVDHTDFSIYRIGSKRKFDVHPAAVKY
jgi:predicted nucleic acid-binding protein